MLQNTKAKKKSYALKTMADYHGKLLEVDFNGMLLNFNGKEFWTTLTGKFNVYNLLLVFGIAEELGFGSTFSNITVAPITDDHHYVFQGSQIPMIDVIQHDPSRNTFAHYWHTHADDMNAVSKETLLRVGKTMSALMFNPPIEIQP